MQALEFEKTILEVEDKIEELRHMSSSEELDVVEEMKRLETKLKKQVSLAYKKLTPLQKTQ
ncbi:MAG: acetyl-CoA carboxylase carboxyl transferase subunit alpha, partial [Alphaproteobacteria bacterium]|nr:acetyl-CoA carboxylase carboxyl transferase subunit alpha [Alphaproteobacteria bacterium]